ncbi:unnamed protein product [Tetraodon nigroviridis]|uniref:(spotted green pufferfish) hypothetical protein n=1 Tax=Tetraodon nigroviridis TaxID=99883 RepID=Q4SD74_TETNG|nr:unnamed protein product [Tetraodon nigroviridis]
MMSSLGNDKAQGPREKALAPATHTPQPQKQIQATAEQIRLAQVIYDKSDADFEDKVNQLMEVTGKNQDECMVALHDCNEDVGRAINFLLESTSDMVNNIPATSYLRQLTAGNEEILMLQTGLVAASSWTFNPADYPSEAGTGATQTEAWDTAANNSSDGTGESWHQMGFCGPLPEGSHVCPFTLTPPTLFFFFLHQSPGETPWKTGHLRTGVRTLASQRLKCSLPRVHLPLRTISPLGKVVGSGSRFRGLGPGQKGSGQRRRSDTRTAQGSRPGPSPVVSVQPPRQQPGQQQFHRSTAELGNIRTSASLVQLGPEAFGIEQHLTSTAGSATAAGAKASAPSTGLDPQGGSTQQQRGPLKAQKRRIPPASKAGHRIALARHLGLLHPHFSLVNFALGPLPRQIPSTAVEMPGSADIPGLNLQFGALDFGSESALTEFGGADNCAKAASRESTPAPTSAPASMAAGAQSQTSLYSKPLSESLGGPLSVALPLSTSEAAYHSSVALPNLAPSSIGSGSPANPPSSSSSAVSSNSSVPSSSHFSTVGGAYDGAISPHTRLAFSHGKESTGPVMNGLNGVRTSAALDGSSSSSTPKADSPSRSISANGHAAPSSHALSAHSSSALANLAPDLPSASQLTSLNR